MPRSGQSQDLRLPPKTSKLAPSQLCELTSTSQALKLTQPHDLNSVNRQLGCRWTASIMPHNPGRKDVQAYPPTSLDFINRPNPVEPLAAPSKHPLHGSAHLHNTHTHDLRRLLLDTVPRDHPTGEAAAKRLRNEDEGPNRSNGNSQARDLPSLPKLPARAGPGTKERRRRLPPTLSGLHQPPPNSGLLPSISVQQPRQSNDEAEAQLPKPRNSRPALNTADLASAAPPANQSTASQPPAGKRKPGKHTKNKWSDEETADLLKGVARFGIGSWTKILRHEDYSFDRRTALDLKDRFRVCCPEHYKKPKLRSSDDQGDASSSSKSQPKGTHRKGASDLARLGIDEPFQKSGRRMRHGYTKEEDEALLRGFQKHGKSWAAIKKDEEVLSQRTSTDLRDRFRLRYPQEYASVGLAPRPEVFPHPPDRGAQEDGVETEAGDQRSLDPPPQIDVAPLRSDQPTSQPTAPPPVHRFIQPGFTLPNDVFFGMPADDEDMDTEPLVLDRGILDWAFETTKPGQVEASNGKLDNMSQHRHMPPPQHNHASSSNATAPLPSLASITAVSDDYDQLELPSLMQYFQSVEGDPRAGGHGFLAFEDLLKQT